MTLVLRIGDKLSVFWITKLNVGKMQVTAASPQDFNTQLLLGVLHNHQIIQQASDKDELGRKVGSPKSKPLGERNDSVVVYDQAIFSQSGG